MPPTNLSRRTLLTAAGAAALVGERRSHAVDNAPEVEIRNGSIRARLYLPDAQKGYYRGARFDWSGIIASLEYAGHRFYGPWFDRVDPPVVDFQYVGNEIVVGRASGAMGPCEEFTALGLDKAAPGGTFVKIGVGVLRKPKDGAYNVFGPQEVVDHGVWHTKVTRSSVTFTHELSDPASGYGYRYEKTIRLDKDEPRLVMEHTLKNTGRKRIDGDVYNHNFLVVDGKGPGPGTVITFPFAVTAEQAVAPELAEVRGKQIRYRKALEGKETVYTGLTGFGKNAKDYDIRVEHPTAGAGYRVRGDRPLSRMALWSIRSNVSVEPFVRMEIAPGGELSWKYEYEYFTLDGARK